MKRFRKSEDGGTTLETVLWVPIFFAFFGLLFDIAMVFNGQAAALRVIQEANRDYSIGTITTTTAARARIKSNLASININVADKDIDPRQNAGVISTRVEIPVAELGSLGWFNAFKNMKVDVTAEQTIENNEVARS